MNMVAIAAQIGPCTPPVPGQGFLEIQGWGASATTLEFTLMENQNRHYLQGDGSWGNAPYWFSSSFAPATDRDALRSHVGEEIVGALLRCSSNVMHMLQLRDPSDNSRVGRQVLRMESGLQLPTAGHTPLSGSGGGLTPPPPIVQPPVEEKPSTMEVPAPVQEPTPPSQPVVTEKEKATETAGTTPPSREEKPKKTWLQRFWWVLLLIALLLAGGAGAAWWFLFKAKPDAAQPDIPEPPAASAPAPAAASAAAAPCSAEAMQADGEMAFVQNCVAQSPTPEALLQTIAAAKQNKHCGIAQRLYANRSQAGDLLIAEAYAKEYDPKFHQASDCFPQPEADTAVYWWETILGFNAQHALAQERMKELKP